MGLTAAQWMKARSIALREVARLGPRMGREAVADAAQDVMLTVAGRLARRYDPARGVPEDAYAYLSTRWTARKAADRLWERERSRPRACQLPDPRLGPRSREADPARRAATREEAARALTSIRDKRRRHAVWLRYCRGMTPPQVAARMRVPQVLVWRLSLDGLRDARRRARTLP